MTAPVTLTMVATMEMEERRGKKKEEEEEQQQQQQQGFLVGRLVFYALRHPHSFVLVADVHALDSSCSKMRLDTGNMMVKV